MKNFGFTINVSHDTNQIIGHSEAEWQYIRKNSLISIDGDVHFYTIGYTEPLNFISDFVVDNNKILIDGQYEHYFIPDDILTVSYKEYELLAILSIINGGSNYKVNDILTLTGGTLSANVSDNKSQNAVFTVEELGNNGKINKLKIVNKGKYIQFPNKTNKLTGGNGKEAEILVESVLIKERKMIERHVVSAQNKDANTIISINYLLPVNVTEGKISMNKYIAYLTSNYVGETKHNVAYNITRDFSPILGLPLLIKGSNKIEETYNYTILKLEKQVQELKEEIKKLKT